MRKLYSLILAAGSVFLLHACEDEDILETLSAITQLQHDFRQGTVIDMTVLDKLKIECLGLKYAPVLGELHTRNMYRIAQIITAQDNLQQYFETQQQGPQGQQTRAVIHDAVTRGWLLDEIDDFESAAAQQAGILKTFGVHDISLRAFKKEMRSAKNRIDDFNRHVDLAHYS